VAAIKKCGSTGVDIDLLPAAKQPSRALLTDGVFTDFAAP
jgi:hypothetical protein